MDDTYRLDMVWLRDIVDDTFVEGVRCVSVCVVCVVWKVHVVCVCVCVGVCVCV